MGIELTIWLTRHTYTLRDVFNKSQKKIFTKKKITNIINFQETTLNLKRYKTGDGISHKMTGQVETTLL